MKSRVLLAARGFAKQFLPDGVYSRLKRVVRPVNVHWCRIVMHSATP
jgi:hypothetical protein